MLERQEPISGRFRLQQRLHRGGMSDVYRAYDELLQCYVAIKLVSNDQPESRQRLLSEIQTFNSNSPSFKWKYESAFFSASQA